MKGFVNYALRKYLFTYLLTYLLTYLPTPRSRVLPENLPGLQLVKKFPAFYGARRSITAFTSARHLPLSWASSIQSIIAHSTSWRSILILCSHLRLDLPSGLSLRFPHQNPVYASLRLIHATCPANPIIFDFINRRVLDDTKAWRVFRLRMEERPPLWRIAANILKKQSQTTDKGWPSSLGIVRGANNCLSLKLVLLRNTNFKKQNKIYIHIYIYINICKT